MRMIPTTNPRRRPRQARAQATVEAIVKATARVLVEEGYDRASNRLWRENPVAAAQSPAVHQDELYSYDGLSQLANFQRGDLNGTKDAGQSHVHCLWSNDCIASVPVNPRG